MKRKSSVTIQDVAKLAGVSAATVSKVINHAPNVSDRSRQVVLDAVRKLNYQPNTIARSLRKRHTRTIGLITDDLHGEFTLSMMHGIEDAANTQGFSVFLCNSQGDMARERAYLETLLAKQTDGIILLSGYRVRRRGAPALPLHDTPVVYLYQYTRDVTYPCVIPDDFGGGLLGTQHLVGLGYQRIAFINGPMRYEAAQARLEGYRQALLDAGMSFEPSLVRTCNKWYEKHGYEMAEELLQLDPRPDAIFCGSDSLANGAQEAIQLTGLRVPDDIALVGFDNRHFTAHKRLPLTTVALPLYEMGALAAELLLRAIQDDQTDEQIHRVPCKLIERESCGRTVHSRES